MIIYFSEKPKINKASGNPVTRVLTQGYNVTFTCDVESGYPEPRVEWWFDWSGKNKEVEVVHYPRYTHPTPKTWLITNIQEIDKGKYRCIAVNEAGEDVQLFHITEVFGKLVSFKVFPIKRQAGTPDTHSILSSN